MDLPGFLSGGDLLWGVAPWRLAAALGIVFAGFASRKAIQAIFLALGHRASGTGIHWDDEAARLLPRPLALVVQVLLWRVAAVLLALPTAPVDIRDMVARGLDAAIMVGIVWTLFRIVDVLALVADRAAATTETRIDDQAVPLLRKTLKVFLGVIGGVFIVSNLGVNVLGALAGLGIGGLALALAAQDSVSNFFGSVVLFTDAPFQVGDYVEVGGIFGTVEEVGFRTTRIRQDDSSVVCVPNQTFTGSFITNLSARRGRMIAVEFGLRAEAGTAALEAFLSGARAALAAQDNLNPSTVEVHLAGLRDSMVLVRVNVFTATMGWADFLATREAALLRLLALQAELGLTMTPPLADTLAARHAMAA
jgi:MscS family membrane protein